ncbi:MAG: HAMP domain-containing protein [Gammaproteobacteria bacterium]
MESEVDNIDRTLQSSLALMLATLGVSLFALIGIGAMVFRGVRGIQRPITAAMASPKIAHGDLTSTIDSQSQDETGQMLRSLKTMQDNLASAPMTSGQ